MTFIGWMMPYCYATSLAPIVYDGMPWVKNIKVKPVKHFLSLINNSIKYIYSLSTQCVGAIAVPDFLVFAEYFIRKDFGEEWYEETAYVELIEQLFQHWIYSVNDKARGNQSPFTNVSVFDKYWREAMFGEHTNPDFSKCDLDNLKRVQRLFVKVLIEQQQDNPFTFPVMTACQLKDAETGEILDKDWLDWIGEISVKNKLMNFYTSDTCDSLSSCCRLRNNLGGTQKSEYTNSFGVGGLNIGSHRVVALNLPQIAYIAKYSDKNDLSAFYNILESRIKIAQDILDIHRELLMRLIDNGNLPMYKHGCMDLSKQYSTLGFIGLYECLEILRNGYSFR
jgi:ribonucleoside-triphosphate reductase